MTWSIASSLTGLLGQGAGDRFLQLRNHEPPPEPLMRKKTVVLPPRPAHRPAPLQQPIQAIAPPKAPTAAMPPPRRREPIAKAPAAPAIRRRKAPWNF